MSVSAGSVTGIAISISSVEKGMLQWQNDQIKLKKATKGKKRNFNDQLETESFGPTKRSTLEVLNNRFLSPMNVTNQ